MIRILVGTFFAFLIFDGGIAVFPVSFIDIESIFLWKNATFNDAVYNWLMTSEFRNISLQRLDKIMIEVDTISEKYNEFTNDFRQKQDERWKFSVDRHPTTEIFSTIKFQLGTLINTVDYLHKERINSEIEREYIDKILHTRITVLSDAMYKLSNTLEQIHKLVFPSFTHITPQLMQLTFVDAEKNLPGNCDKYTSAQQFVYYIYITLIITEMKGFSTLIYVSSILQHATESNLYITEMEIAEQKFTKRVTDYYNNIYKAMFLIPREIHRCNLRFPKRDENFLEFVHYHQVWLITTGHLKVYEPLFRLNCFDSCEGLNTEPLGILTDMKISDCETIGLAKFMKSCAATPGSSRRYMWWMYNDKIYGHNEGCPSKIEKGNGDMPYYDHCHICQCTVVLQDDKVNAILRIGVSPQVSDIENNMIVSGVKFVVYEKALHLQIQQSKFVLNEINDNSSVWKSLENHQPNFNHSGIQSQLLSKFSGQIYLDDVMLPPKYAVTGVRFMSRSASPEGFFLQVHGTPIDLTTGRLDTTESNWFVASFDLSQTADYQRDRIKINVQNLDDPTRCRDYDYDRTANNYIKFHHSSVSKDGGQSTVPFIDAQSVETYPPFPLSGIGLFYRNKVGCGGYITPRIFTIDITQYK